MGLFSSGADIDLKRLEEEIRKEIEEKKNRLFTEEELEELQKLELQIPVNPDRVRTFFLKELDFGNFETKLPEFFRGDYNINLNTFLVSEHAKHAGLLNKLRNWMRPFFRLYGNIDAVIHKQALYNAEQVGLNSTVVQIFERLFHYIRTLHTIANYLVSELTKLHLQHNQLKAQVDALAYDVEQLRKRERLLEKLAVLKEEKTS